MTDLRLHVIRTKSSRSVPRAAIPAPFVLGFGEKSEGWHNFAIEQGHAMGQASIIEVAARVEGGHIVATRLSGHAKVLGEEDITLAAG